MASMPQAAGDGRLTDVPQGAPSGRSASMSPEASPGLQPPGHTGEASTRDAMALCPLRSVLYIPASRERAIDKARELPCDAIIFDLEDAVAPDEKPGARDLLLRALAQGGFGGRTLLVRVNGPGTVWGQDDLAALRGVGVSAVLIPKVGTAADLDSVARLLPATALWAMMETPQAVLNAREIAAHPAAGGLVMGTNDLLKDLCAHTRPDRLPLLASLQHCLLAARAAGIPCIDGVYNTFQDEAGLLAECEQGRDMGFDGKSLIHPSQLAVANRVFAPSPDDLALARAQIAAFAEAQAAGRGVAVLDGRIVENLHVAAARRMLAKAEAISVRA